MYQVFITVSREGKPGERCIHAARVKSSFNGNKILRKKVLSLLHASVKNPTLSIYSPLKYREAHLESGSSETRIRGEGVERGKLEGENPSPSCVNIFSF